MLPAMRKMSGLKPRQIIDQPAQYEIILLGRLGEHVAASFPGMDLRIEDLAGGSRVTILNGVLVDQAALHGLLVQIRDLGLALISVRRL